jgi:hypothetical protein
MGIFCEERCHVCRGLRDTAGIYSGGVGKRICHRRRADRIRRRSANANPMVITRDLNHMVSGIPCIVMIWFRCEGLRDAAHTAAK